MGKKLKELFTNKVGKFNSRMSSRINKSKIKAGARWVVPIFFIFVAGFIFMMGGVPPFLNLGWEGKYSLQAGLLYPKIINALVATGYCPDKKKCSGVYGDHSNGINFYIYGINDQKVITSIVSMATTEGMETTGGVPISIRFYSKPHEELMGFKSFTTKPAIILEINK